MAGKKSEAIPAGGMSREDIERLIDVIHQKGIEEFELEQGGIRVRIVAARKNLAAPTVIHSAAHALPQVIQQAPAPAPIVGTSSTPAAAAPAAEDANLTPVTSPMVGTFYRASSPTAKPFAEVGDKVSEDTVLCIIEAMKLMNEIKAETRGTIRKILVQNAQPVEYGQPLFLIDPG
ncbi:MAG TPA: acetyl-CoA carboxylase biotin carboxyl carrier protein [Candidatus Sumerlaeota bacterium]|nr:acetyl-CoA carboxylase biotin carboxyl carrier protein [Candidatus Sumerlaeota bacterium]